MPRRGSRAAEDDDLIRRNPRRAGYSKSMTADDDSDEDDPMEVDEESEGDADVPSDDYDSESEVPIRRMANRRRAAASSNSKNSKGNKTQKQLSSSNARRSSRSTRFTGAMKEPNPDSLQDLFAGVPAKIPTKSTNKSSKKKMSDDSASEDEAPPLRKRNQTPKLPKQPSKKSVAKSPARRHSTERKTAKADLSSDTEFSEEEADYEEGGDDEELKIQRILASRTETKAKWREICKNMNTSEVTDGSRWFQEHNPEEDDIIEERFLIKWSGLSYVHVSWETQSDLMGQTDGAKTYMGHFFRKSMNGVLFTQDERKDGDYFDPGFVQIDRILEIHFDGKRPKTPEEEDAAKPGDFGIITDPSSPEYEKGVGRQFLVKWESMNYSETSYEFERDLILADIEYKDKLKEFYARTKKPNEKAVKSRKKKAEEEARRGYKIFGDKMNKDEAKKEEEVQQYQKDLANHVYKNGGQLRDYQAEGISWFLSNYINNRSCILADEMGLGKTLQTAAFCDLLFNQMHRPGPFLIIVPLSTVAHWQREFVGWTELNTFIYHGSAEDRRRMREKEFAFEQDRPTSVGANALYLKKCKGHGAGPWMAQVVITTPEVLVADDWQELAAVDWEVLVVDEAHRLKNHNSKLALNLRKGNFNFKHKILLTGTPIQNDVKEFWTLLNFIDPKNFESMDEFLEKYGSIKSKDRIDELHETIRPYILRRLKEDVEKSVPPKEETLIEVELTVTQKQYYRALYEKNVGFLHKNKKKALDGPSLNNLAMQLRKCCNHLFLLNGVEEEIRKQHKGEAVDEADFLARGSGKLVLLDKLLPRLKENGHRILIFSQFKIMLDILEDYLHARAMKYERIDGSITGQKRQRAIDRFQDESLEDPPFVMLLSTRAGGVGINLTSADTCIIFDSDWNPQNDLQAQARCHRIGQTKNVKVYRLLSRKTYEMQMFHMSSLKMGLDQAVLKGFESNASGESTMTKEEVERLLRHGAYDIFNEDKAGAAEAESNDFVQQDIDSILERRSRTVTHANTGSASNAAGGTFSKASFVAPKSSSDKTSQTTDDVDIEDPEFWTKVVGEAPAEEVELELKPRKRNQANYSEKLYEKKLEAHIANDGDASDSSGGDDDEEFSSSDEEGNRRMKERTRWGGQQPIHWKRNHAESLLRCLERYGYCVRGGKLFERATGLNKFAQEEVIRMAWSIILVAFCEGARDEVAGAKRRADRQAEKRREDDGDGEKTEKKDEFVQESDAAIDAAFERLWKANTTWAHLALSDAVSFARKNEPRTNVDDDDKKDDVVSRLFYGTLWPSLQGRGWKEETSPDGKVFKFNFYTFDSPNMVMMEVLRIHPELQNMVLPLLKSIEEARLNESKKDEANRNKDLSLNPENVDVKSLSNFLRRYAPLQLIGDRKSTRRLPIGRRVLSSCFHMHLVNTIMTAATLPDKNLSDLLVVDARSALPHPLWTSNHDATLIQAIAKHGWVDRDKSCKAIIEDPTIHWGHPFEVTEGSNNVDISEEELTRLKATAARAAVFMENNYEIIEQMKGCSRHMIIDSYGLKHEAEDGADPDSITWVVDEQMLMQACSNSQSGSDTQDPLDLPIKKDMAKRAKTLLVRSLAVLTSGRAAESQNSSAMKHGDKSSGGEFGYAMLDQGDRACILLAEMVKGIVKGSHTKMSSQVRMLCSLAYEEALALKKSYPKGSKKASEMQSIADQIALSKKSLRSAAIPGKNVLRVMLGLEPVPPRNTTEKMFPTHEMLDEENAKLKLTVKKDPVKRDEGAAGERAIARAMKKAHDKVIDSPCMFATQDDPDVGLQLTMIETLILFAFCSEGIPLSKVTVSGSDDNIMGWDDVGSVIEIAAKDYYQASKEKLEKARLALKKLEHYEENVAKSQAASKVATAEFDETAKEEAARQAVEFASNPDQLAKKSIMLIEKVRRFGFSGSNAPQKNSHKYENGLGPKVPGWLSKELSKMADEFDIADGTGKPMCFTTTDLLSQNPEFANTTVAAYLDKKSARQVISQISLLCRLRAIFMKNSEDSLRSKLAKAIKNSKKLEELWDKQPPWWDESTTDHSLLLLKRLNQFGFLNLLSDPTGFGPPDQTDATSLKDYGLTKAVVQQRANQLIRELHALEESEEMIRLLQERRNKSAARKQKKLDSLVDCKVPSATPRGSSKKSHSKSGGIQTGLRAFFVSTKSNSKKQKVIVLDHPEDDSTLESTGKRKESSSDEDSPRGKKARSDTSISSEESHPTSKQFQTVVNEDGVIELITVQK